MRVWHFSETAYPFLPDASEYASVRVTLPNRYLDPEIASRLINERLAEWKLCDELGLNIIVNEHHLRRLLTEYIAYYHRWRTHLSLAMDCPEPRPVEPPACGTAVAVAEVGGLHHHYERQAA